MNPGKKHHLCLVWFLGMLPMAATADVLISTNGERFVGTILVETTNSVVFESGFAGRLTFVPAQIRKLERALPAETNAAPAPAVVTPAAVTKPPSATNLLWLPPGVGQDGADWIQLKSGEWLRGELKYIQEKDVEFDSDELEEQSLKLKDIRQLYTAHRMLTRFEGQESVHGAVVLSNGVVTVRGPDTISMPQEELTGITPGGGGQEIRYWSGKVEAGATVQSGNSKQTTISTSAELARRTPNTRLLMDYLGNYSEVNHTQNANNDRGNLTYDIRLNRDWFVRPVQCEVYRDPLANIAYRLTGGVGAGYYIFDRDGLEWIVSAGPGFQYTRFDTVEPGRAETSSTAAGVLQMQLEYDLTRRLTFTQTIQSTFTDREAGQYTHHAVSTLEFEIKRHLNLDISYIWDYLQNPQAKSDGSLPLKSDTYLTVGFGVRF
jgi:putative salt-induced outer membrane protein YdiY